MSKFKGVKACEDALSRLIDGNPESSEFVGVPESEITAAMVSIEAGFDKGYLKKSRDQHKPLIARIAALKNNLSKSDSVNDTNLKKAKKATEKAKAEKIIAKQMLDKVLTQNLMLVERIKELEKELSKYQSYIGK